MDFNQTWGVHTLRKPSDVNEVKITQQSQWLFEVKLSIDCVKFDSYKLKVGLNLKETMT